MHFEEYPDYETANRKAKKGEVTSNVDSDDAQRKRCCRIPARYNVSCTDTDDLGSKKSSDEEGNTVYLMLLKILLRPFVRLFLGSG